jgi:hypothetical protein
MIRIRTTLASDTPHLPELAPLVGRPVVVTIEEEPAPPLPPGVTPGTGDWKVRHVGGRHGCPPSGSALRSCQRVYGRPPRGCEPAGRDAVRTAGSDPGSGTPPARSAAGRRTS